MSVVDQLIVGLKLTVTGMVTVFVLLAFMVVVIHWMSKLAHRLQPPPRQQPLTSTGSPSAAQDPALVSAISAAIHRYRSERRQAE
jgi:oxaloacetate decarboxylase gamma subunit